MSETTNFSLDNQVRYRSLFEGQSLTPEARSEVQNASQAQTMMAEAIKAAATSALAMQLDQLDPDLKFKAPTGMPTTDGVTSLRQVADYLTKEFGFSPYSAQSPIGGTAMTPSLKDAFAQVRILEDSSARLSSQLNIGAGSGISVVDGQFYMNGQAINIEEVYVAVKVNQTHNHQVAIKDLTLEVENRTRELRQAQDFLTLLNTLMPRNDDHKFHSWDHHDYFQQWDKYGYHEDTPTGQPTNIKIGVYYPEAPYWNLNSNGTPEWINIHWIPENERRSLHSIFSDFQTEHGMNELPITRFTDEVFGDQAFNQLDFKKWVQGVKSHISKLQGENQISQLNIETHHNQLNESIEQMSKMASREHGYMGSINRNL